MTHRFALSRLQRALLLTALLGWSCRPSTAPEPPPEQPPACDFSDGLRGYEVDVVGRIVTPPAGGYLSPAEPWTAVVCDVSGAVRPFANALPATYTLDQIQELACDSWDTGGQSDTASWGGTLGSGWTLDVCDGDDGLTYQRARGSRKSDIDVWGAEEWIFRNDGTLVSVEYWDFSVSAYSVCCSGELAFGAIAGDRPALRRCEPRSGCSEP